jgi:putative ABC transport system permease protein
VGGIVRAIVQDLREAARDLRRNPKFALTVLSLLSVGIGTNVAVFTVVHALLLQPLPYADPDRLVRLWETNPQQGISRSAVSRGNFFDWRERAASFDYIEAFGSPGDRLVRFGSSDPEIMRQASGTDTFLEMLGVAPVIGGNTKGLRLSHAFWQRRFGGDLDVVGAKYVFEGFAAQPSTVGAVMPKGFDFPAGADAWRVMSFGRERSARDLSVLARVKPGVSLEQARAEMEVLAAALAAEHPAENAGWRVEMVPLHETIVGDVRATLWLLYGAVCLLLVIAVSNAAGLVLARLTQIQRDRAVRLALGASVWRLLRQQMFECGLLAGAAGLGGLAIAGAAIKVMLALAPPTIPRLSEIRVTSEIVSVTLAVAAVVGLLLWVLSAFGNRLRVTALTAGGRQAGSAWTTRTRSAIVVGQIAFCVGLLMASALVVRSFLVIQGAPNGFDSGGVLSVQIRHPIMNAGEVVKHYPTRRFVRVTDELVTAAHSLPGVESTAGAWYAPFTRRSARRTDYMILDKALIGPLSGAAEITGPGVRDAQLQISTPGYFTTLRIPLLAGRPFGPADRLAEREIDDRDAPRGAGVAIISAALARREWPTGGALGRFLAVSNASYRSVQVIGIVGDVRSAPGTEPVPAIYLPYAQAPESEVTLLVRTTGDPSAIAPELRNRLRTFGAEIGAFNVRTMDEIVAGALARPRFNSAVMAWFGAAGVLFMAAGLYSLLSFVVAQRTRELAVRLAVGASAGHILRLVVGRGLALAIVGTAVGAGSGWLGHGLVRSVLPEILPGDPWTILIPAGAVLAVALLASYIPARRAARIDPVVALRTE